MILIVFALIIIVMIVANLRSGSKEELKGPVGGVAELKTCNGKLTAISRNNEMYVWRWDDLSGGFESTDYKAGKITAADNAQPVRIAVNENKLITDNGKETLITYKQGVTLLKTSKNGKLIAVANPNPDWGYITVKIFDAELNYKKTITADYPLQPKEIALSNGGNKIGMTFEKQKGFLVVYADKNNEWKYENTEYPAFNKLIFSPNSEFLFVCDTKRNIYQFDIKSKKLVKTFEIKKYKTPANNPQTITCITISDNGKLLSAGSSPGSKIYIWDTLTGEKLKVIQTGFFCASGIAFSPNNKKLAVSDLTTRGINIVNISDLCK